MIEADEKFENCFTGGRDGKIYKVNVIDDKISMIYDGDSKNPIIGLKYDNKYHMLWFSTPSSNF